ncbi:MAG: GntR family transcriptional regulator [Polaromonas sp.]
MNNFPALSEDDIYHIVKKIILSAQLPPGTRLPEARLAPLFGVTRERLRKVLHRLGHEQTLQIVPNIGTVVPTPSLDSARELFEARRVLEAGICMRLCEKVTAVELDQLRAHLALERQTANSGLRPNFIITSSQFHLLLAKFLNNALVTAQLELLLTKSALFSTFHDPKNVSMCSCYEHEQIAQALEKRDIHAAYHATVSHLSLIETRLQMDRRAPSKVDVPEIFRHFLEAQMHLQSSACQA